jgi:hypothetical protein
MRERFTLHQLRKLAAAHDALRLASETTVVRQQAEQRQQHERVETAREALSERYRIWEGHLARGVHPELLRLQAEAIPRLAAAVATAQRTLTDIDRRLEASRLVLAHATVRERLNARRAARLRKAMARRAEEKRMQAWEEVVTRQWGAQ